MLKQSKFNYIYKRNDNETIIFNTYSKGTAELEDWEYADYLNGAYGEMAEVLEQLGILVKEDFDEIHFLKYMHYKAKFAKNRLHLTIAPTLDCNFDCPYCYENRRQGKMSQEMQDALVRFIEQKITEGAKDIDISWYGGEPLLYFPIVESLARRIQKLSDENDCNLKMFIVTNGYLLTKEIVEKMDEIGILRVQITLDGLKEHHDKSRPLRNGEGTFDRIFENLKLFGDSPIQVVIRMNVDNRNYMDYKQLKEMIQSLDNYNISLYPSPVEDINKDKLNQVSEFMTSDEFEGFALQECEDANDDVNDYGVMDDRCCYCAAELENSYVIDERGDVYKCWDEVGREEYICFSVASPEEVNYTALLKYLTCDVFEDEDCKECTFLPLCFGGCKFQKNQLQKKNCGFSDEVMREYLENTVLKNRVE